jgi:hypothetical protein
MSPMQIAAALAAMAPDVVEAVADFVDGLSKDNATQARRAAGVAVARAHKRAVETAVRESAKRLRDL